MHYFEDELIPVIPHLTVWEEEPFDSFTGLYDSDGTPIYSVTVRDRIGFDLS